MYLHAETVSLDSDEGRFTLEILDAESGKRLTVNIHDTDLDTFYDQVKERLGSYLAEKEAAFSEFRSAVKSGAFVCAPEDIDESGGYDISDPKHPEFHSVHADIWDSRAGK